jgi:uncharacterized protein YbjT (DUF2867 family)
MTTTLVTGATGAVGSRYAARLLADPDHTVRVLVRGEGRVAPWWDRGAEVVEGDLRDPDTLKQAVTGVARVVHLAAPTRTWTGSAGWPGPGRRTSGCTCCTTPTRRRR